MFITSFFGMNVDILAKDPSWHLYFFVSIPFLAIVIAVWVLCKYLPLSEFFERGVGNYLSWAFGEGERRPKPLAFESQVVDITPGYKSSIGGIATGWLYNRRRSSLPMIHEHVYV